MDCRPGCGACCIAPSISSPLPGQPAGKKAGEPCPALLADYRCGLFDDPRRPAVCASLKPCLSMCGNLREQALSYLINLEQATAPMPVN